MPFIGLFIGPIKVESKVCNMKVQLHSQFWFCTSSSQQHHNQHIPIYTHTHALHPFQTRFRPLQVLTDFSIFFLKPVSRSWMIWHNRDRNWDKSNKSAHFQPLRLSALWNNVLRNHQMASSLPELPSWWGCHEKREQWIQCSLLDGCEDFRVSPTMICAQEELFSLGKERKARSATRWSLWFAW